jgi:hypothetical protein
LCTFFAPAVLRTVPCSTSRRQDRCIGRQHTVSWSAGRQMSIGSSAKHLQPANCYAVCTRGYVCNWQPSRSLRAGSPQRPLPSTGATARPGPTHQQRVHAGEGPARGQAQGGLQLGFSQELR